MQRDALRSLGIINRMKTGIYNITKTSTEVFRREIGGPTRTRTWDQWIHIVTIFQPCADYLISLASHLRCVRERDALACY